MRSVCTLTIKIMYVDGNVVRQGLMRADNAKTAGGLAKPGYRFSFVRYDVSLFVNQMKGSLLKVADRRKVLESYVHRHTGDHIPAYVAYPREPGTVHPLQFASDQDWLENTTFDVNDKGELLSVHRNCCANPTWPNNPELRMKG